MNFFEQYQNPRWQKIRLAIFERDDWACTSCGESTEQLHVHHDKYTSRVPWLEPMENLRTVCGYCHEKLHPNRKGNENDSEHQTPKRDHNQASSPDRPRRHHVRPVCWNGYRTGALAKAISGTRRVARYWTSEHKFYVISFGPQHQFCAETTERPEEIQGDL